MMSLYSGDVHQCSPVFFLLNIIYFSVCLTSNKWYWIEDQLADVSTWFYTLASWTVGELTGYRNGMGNSGLIHTEGVAYNLKKTSTCLKLEGN